MDARLLNALDAGHTIVTASRRLARFVRLELAQAQAARGARVWTPPSVIALDGWLAREHEAVRWSASGSARVLLNAAQEQRVWEQLVVEDGAAEWVDAAATARLARAAWSLVHAWRLPDPGQLLLASDEVRAFARWMRAYHQRCTEEGWLDRARLPDALRVAYGADVIPAPAGLLMLGFEQLTPQQRALLRELEKRGARVEVARGPRQKLNAERVELASFENELATAARWARQLLATGSARRIGIVVPQIAARRETVQRVLDDVLVPGAELPGRVMPRRPYNLAAGGALADYPVVRDARAVLQLVPGCVLLSDLTRLLRSPFIAGGITRAPQRALFDAWLRQQGVVELDFGQFPRYLAAFTDSRHSRPADVALHSPFERAHAALPAPSACCLPDIWAAAMSRCLQAFGWPGERKLTPAEQQAIAAFNAVLGRFASLELVQGPLDARSALRQLASLLVREAFQVESPEAPIQVLDLLDAYGLGFDELWISGLDDDAWPPQADPNPFIPIEWQRQHKLPGGTPEAQLDLAQRVTHRLLSASKHVIVSHAVRDGDRSRGPSPLVRALVRREEPELDLAQMTDYRGVLLAAAALEVVQDDRAPPLAPAEAVRGGTRVLKLQAACPFRAFGELRLHATALATAEPGLATRTRGTLLHGALERVWRELGSSQALHRLDERARAALITRAAEGALNALELEQMAPVAARRRAVEVARLSGTLRDWLALESERAPFEIRNLESQRNVKLAGMELSTRADRVDRLADNSVVIIDYKTGAADRRAPGCWTGERPDEPQIPLYAIAEEEPLAGLFIAHVRPGRPSFSGAARGAGVAPGHDDREGPEAGDLRELRRRWRESLGGLAEQYASGDARVDPKYKAQTCRQCELSLLCRVAELAVPTSELPDA